jgi:hypothetical protein
VSKRDAKQRFEEKTSEGEDFSSGVVTRWSYCRSRHAEASAGAEISAEEL